MTIPAGYDSRFVTANGVRHHVVSRGSGAPLVFLHGWPEFWRTWRPLMDRLSDRFTTIAPEWRGFGDSEKTSPGPAEDCAPDILATDLHALLDALGLDRVGLVSHDVGAFAAQEFARRWPERLSGLFFFDCPYPGIGARWAQGAQINEVWYQSFNQQPWAAALVGASRGSCRTYIGHFLRHWAHDKGAFDGELETWVDNFMKPGNLQGGFNWYRSINRARLAIMAGAGPTPPPIATRSRFLWGRRDPILRAAWTDRLHEFFTDYRLEFAEFAGHFPHVEAPDLAAGKIAAFFK
ncbi:MAG: alpha/beta hydrolase [Rhodospirillales bacterium]|nr:MAG: alpha/beta hydrolase [Rhodospirillales bacterium]